MIDSIQNNLLGGGLHFLNRIRFRITVEKNIQFWNFGDPATVGLTVKFDGELHSSRLKLAWDLLATFHNSNGFLFDVAVSHHSCKVRNGSDTHLFNVHHGNFRITCLAAIPYTCKEMKTGMTCLQGNYGRIN